MKCLDHYISRMNLLVAHDLDDKLESIRDGGLNIKVWQTYMQTYFIWLIT